MSERWKPEDTYYFIDSIGMIGIHKWCNDSADNAYYESGNCFKTEAAAKAASEKVKSLLFSLHDESTAECIQLTKLTTEVFDREDCPQWARYAAVDKNGAARFHAEEPSVPVTFDGEWWCSEGNDSFINGRFDASDWKNSLIARPAKENKLPEWCKVDAMGWHKRCGYFKVTYIDDVSKRVDIQQAEDGSKGYLSFHTVCNDTVQASPRPYNAYEMEALVGKVLKHDTGNYLVTAFEHRWNQVTIESVWRDADELLKVWTKLDGQPCGVLKHLNEKGEWVK